jgi:hypothetical protein
VLRLIRIASLFVALLTPSSAAAQDNKVFVGVSGMWSTQRAGTPCQGSSCATPAVGGTAFGIGGEVGARFSDRLSVEVEGSVPLSRFEAVQYTAIPGSQTDSRHRDLIISGLLHVEVPPAVPVRIGIVGGVSAVQEDTLQRVAFGPFGSTSFGPYGPETTLTRWTLALTAGGEVVVAVTHHILVVPQIRVHWIDRASDGGPDFMLALGSVVVRPAVGVRLAF